MLAQTALSTLTSPVHTTSSAAPTTTVIKDRPQPSKLEQILLDLNLRTNSLQSQASPELATPDDNYQVSQRLRMSYFKSTCRCPVQLEGAWSAILVHSQKYYFFSCPKLDQADVRKESHEGEFPLRVYRERRPARVLRMHLVKGLLGGELEKELYCLMTRANLFLKRL